MNKYVIFSIIGLMVVLSAGTALAYQSDFVKPMHDSEEWQAKHESMQEQKVVMDEIFTNKDYSAWEELMSERVINIRMNADDLSSKISEGNFTKMAEAHALMQAGNYEGARTLHEELGLGGPKEGFGGHRGGGFGQRGMNRPLVE